MWVGMTTDDRTRALPAGVSGAEPLPPPPEKRRWGGMTTGASSSTMRALAGVISRWARVAWPEKICTPSMRTGR